MGLFNRESRSPLVPNQGQTVVWAHVAEQTEIVGLGYHLPALARAMTHSERRALEVPVDVELTPEPTNPTDPNAIGAYWRGEHIGYVAKGETSSYHRQIRGLERGARLGVHGVLVLRGGARYLRVYHHVAVVTAPVGPPGPLLTIGGMQVQYLDQDAITRWIAWSGRVGEDVINVVAQLALHPFGPADVLVLLDGQGVGGISQSKRVEVAHQVKTAAHNGETLGARVRINRGDDGWRIWIERATSA